jgi:hypothetical integral membrane protein (TIGR02206 family)
MREVIQFLIVGPYFAYDYAGAPFEQLGVAHLAALLAILLLIVAGWRGRFSDGQRRGIRLGLALLLLANELFWHAWHAYFGLWSVRTLLPLNICNLMVFYQRVGAADQRPAAMSSFICSASRRRRRCWITPALGPHGFPHVLFFQIFISHGGIIVAALYLTLGEACARPPGGRWARRAWTILYALFIFGLNQALGSNYLFLAYSRPPPHCWITWGRGRGTSFRWWRLGWGWQCCCICRFGEGWRGRD